MVRLLLMIVLFLLSLLTVFKAPANLLWYVSILVTECSWAFICLTIALIFWRSGLGSYRAIVVILGLISITLLSIPITGAYRISKDLSKNFNAAFNDNAAINANAVDEGQPFSFLKMFTGLFTKQAAYRTVSYDSAKKLTLDFYPAKTVGQRPCVVVVHGGSWAAGDSRQLPELNTELVKAGYHVATINYRLAPKYLYPAPIEDIRSALNYLRGHAAQLHIDTGRFILLGRSAGGQIVLSAAYTLQDPGIKAVISFYGPADMVWGYANPTNPLVLNSRKVMQDYLGGSYQKVPQQYINSSATATTTRSTVATLLIHGKNDPLVSYEHGTRLSARLNQLQMKHYELYLPWATHAFDWTLNGPGGQLSTWTVMQFLKKVTG